MFGSGFSAKKLKPQLKMAVSRFQIASNKKTAMLKQQCREVAMLLHEDPPKEEKARIRAEALIRDDNMIEAYEILQLECELLSERLKLLEHSKECPPDLVTCISDLLYAAQRVDIAELSTIRLQFRAKYGKEFEERALSNTGGILNERVVTKLSFQPPAAYLVQTYLEKICEQYEVDWKPRHHLTAAEMAQPMAPPVGWDVRMAPGTGLGVTTGQAHVDDNESSISGSDYKKGGGGGGGDGGDLPPIPMPPPVVTATPYMPNNNNNNNNGGGDDYGEVDIFVPSAPTAPPGQHNIGGSSAASSTTNTRSNNNNNHHNNGGGGGGSMASTGLGSSYDDLAAQFESLKKK